MQMTRQQGRNRVHSGVQKLLREYVLKDPNTRKNAQFFPPFLSFSMSWRMLTKLVMIISHCTCPLIMCAHETSMVPCLVQLSKLRTLNTFFHKFPWRLNLKKKKISVFNIHTNAQDLGNYLRKKYTIYMTLVRVIKDKNTKNSPCS